MILYFSYLVSTQLSTWCVPSPMLSLKALDFELQRHTRSSGVESSILLVSPGPSLAEVCATCLTCQLCTAQITSS